jgi:hypothetical protein
MTQESYSAVVELLGPVAETPGAASLLFLLEEARDRLQSLQRDVDATLHAVEFLTDQEHYVEAIKFLESQPPSILHSDQIQAAVKRLHAANDNELAALQAVGKAYAALDRPEIDTDSFPSSGKVESSLLTRIVPIYASRRKTVADRQLSAALEQARLAMDAGDKKQASRALTAAKMFADYASSDLQNAWRALSQESEKSKVFGRHGQK